MYTIPPKKKTNTFHSLNAPRFLDYFRGHPKRSPNHCPALRDGGRELGRHPKVRQLGFPVDGEEDVAGLEVPVFGLLWVLACVFWGEGI